MLRHYILSDDNRVIASSLEEWAVWYQNNPDKCVIRKTYFDDCEVSTVFLGLDHGFGMRADDEPILFETMVFGGPQDDSFFQQRYSTYEQACDGHAGVVEWIIDQGDKDEADS